jgi:tRNA A-37 threonylcarbamoyl transferase component Bud32
MDLRDQLGRTLGDSYTLDRELGGGGMSRVFVAQENALGRTVVVKVLPAEMAGQLSFERFRREIAIAARLQHAHIVPVLTAGEVEGLPYYTMPYVDGESLRLRLARGGELPLNEAVRILREVASALAYAHDRGVVHRDIKPDNVLLSGGAAMVTDFGVAKALSASATGDEKGSGLTSLGVALGTPAYMAPEQAAADPLTDRRADIYAWGVMAYELLTGQAPFAGRSPQAMLAAHISEPPEMITNRRATIPPPLAQLVMRCLEKRAADRPQTAAELVHALDALVTPTSGMASSVAPTGAVSQRRPLFVAAIAVVAGIAVFATWRTFGRAPQSLNVSHVVIVRPAVEDPTLASVAQALPDVLSRALGEMSWAKVVEAPDGSPSGALTPRAAASLGRRADAGTIVSTNIVAAGDSAQIQFRVLDGTTGAAIRTLAPVRVGRAGNSAQLAAVSDGLLATLAYVTHPEFGAAMLPLGNPPALAAFRELEFGVSELQRGDYPTRSDGIARLAHAHVLDTTFFQARIWLAFAHEWYGWNARVRGGAELIDTVAREIQLARGRLAPFDAAMADFVAASAHEMGDPSLNALRRMVQLSPSPRLKSNVATFLADLDRPREALAITERELAAVPKGDTTRMNGRGAYEMIALLNHFLGDHKSELAAAKHAREMAPNSTNGLRYETIAFAALGDTAAVRRNLDQVEGSSSEDRLFAFPGDIYLQAGQELIAHGYPELGRQTVERSVAWFERHRDLVNAPQRGAVGSGIDIGLRGAIAYEVLGYRDTALKILRAISKLDTTDTRVRGYIGRMLAATGDTAGAARELAWLAAKPAALMAGAPTYERAAINARLGPAHWDEATTLLQEALRQGQGFGILRRVHFFSDWLPLKDYPAFKRILEPKG